MISKDEFKKHKLCHLEHKVDYNSQNEFFENIVNIVPHKNEKKLITDVSLCFLLSYAQQASENEFILSYIEPVYYIYSKLLIPRQIGEFIVKAITSLQNKNYSELINLQKKLFSRHESFSKKETLFEHIIHVICDILRKNSQKIIINLKLTETELIDIEIILAIDAHLISKASLTRNLKYKENFSKVIDWHIGKNYKYTEKIKEICCELQFHSELNEEKKVELLTCIEFIKTYEIRKNGIGILPDEWIASQTLKIDYQKLDEIWLRPSQSYLYRELKNSTENGVNERLKKLEERENFKKRGFDISPEERKIRRLEKLQNSVDNNKVIIFLGRQNHIYIELQKKLNEQNNGELIYISDHVWSTCGFIEPGVKSSNSRLSILQAAETVRRLNGLGINGQSIAKREIAFSLDGYDVKHAFAAMYSNPNRIERNYGKPNIEGIDHFDFAYTGLTDLELANIVRNKDWFDLLTFYRTGINGQPEKLTKQQVAEEYGIKYIGDLMIEKIKKKSHNRLDVP